MTDRLRDALLAYARLVADAAAANQAQATARERLVASQAAWREVRKLDPPDGAYRIGPVVIVVDRVDYPGPLVYEE